MTRRRGFSFVVAAAVIAVLGLFAAVDHARTENRVPPVPGLCPPGDSACEADRSGDLGDRLREARRLEDSFGRRVWVYALAGVGAVLAGLAYALRQRPDRQTQRRVFADVGVLGVCVLVATSAFLLVVQRGGLIDFPAWPAYLPGLVALGAAALGGARARLLTGRKARPGVSTRRLPRYAARGGLALTGLTVLLAAVYVQAQPSCGSDEEAASWADELGWTAVATGLTAMALALAGLVARRWVVALVCLAVNPAAALWMLLSSWCSS